MHRACSPRSPHSPGRAQPLHPRVLCAHVGGGRFSTDLRLLCASSLRTLLGDPLYGSPEGGAGVSHLAAWLFAIVAIVVILTAVAVAGLARRARSEGGGWRALLRRVDPAASRDDLLRRGLRMQATITDIRSPRAAFSRARSRGRFATTATAYDLETGQPRRFTQRDDAPLGHRGDPVTVLVDPARPDVYLIVR